MSRWFARRRRRRWRTTGSSSTASTPSLTTSPCRPSVKHWSEDKLQIDVEQLLIVSSKGLGLQAERLKARVLPRAGPREVWSGAGRGVQVNWSLNLSSTMIKTIFYLKRPITLCLKKPIKLCYTGAQQASQATCWRAWSSWRARSPHCSAASSSLRWILIFFANLFPFCNIHYCDRWRRLCSPIGD